MTIDFTKLGAPFNPTSISWRVGAKSSDSKTGLALAYIDARDVMDRLDEVCGPDGWADRYTHGAPITICEISIWCGPERGWVSKANGAGQTDVEAEKGAASDAFKRAAVLWNIGRYLYDFPKIWAKIRPQGKSYVIDEGEYPRLIEIAAKHSAGVKVPDSLPPRHQDSDAANGHAEWVGQQKLLLQNLTNFEEVREWQKTNKANIDKLSRDNLPLYGDLKRAFENAKDRTRREAA